MRPRTLGIILALAIVAADQASKEWMHRVLEAAGGFIELTPFFNLVVVYNTGISFGMLAAADARWVLVALTGAITIALLVWLWRGVPMLLAVALGMILGGAVGNLIDRVLFGSVFDFLDLHAMGWHWPAFNLADAAICVGAGLVLLDAVLKRPARPAK